MRNIFSVTYNPRVDRWFLWRSVDGGEWSAIGSVDDAELRHMKRHCATDSRWPIKDMAAIAYGYMAAKFKVFDDASGWFERLR